MIHNSRQPRNALILPTKTGELTGWISTGTVASSGFISTTTTAPLSFTVTANSRSRWFRCGDRIGRLIGRLVYGRGI